MIAHLLNVSVTVWRRSSHPDGSGGVTETWDAVAELPARVSPIERVTPDLVVAATETQRRSRVVYFDDAFADVDRGDRIVLDTPSGPRTMHVDSWDYPSIPIYRRTDVTEIQPGG